MLCVKGEGNFRTKCQLKSYILLSLPLTMRSTHFAAFQ